MCGWILVLVLLPLGWEHFPNVRGSESFVRLFVVQLIVVQSTSYQLLTLSPSFFLLPLHTTLARLAFQNKHYTSTKDMMQADAQRDPVGVSMCRTNKSVVGRDFITVALNQGMLEFDRDKHLNAALVSKLPFEKML